MNFNKWSKW